MPIIRSWASSGQRPPWSATNFLRTRSQTGSESMSTPSQSNTIASITHTPIASGYLPGGNYPGWSRHAGYPAAMTAMGSAAHQALVKQVTAHYAGDPRVRAVAVFGSVGSGTWHELSDVDLDIVT